MSLECLSSRKDSILDDDILEDQEVGACFMCQDEQVLRIIRAGSAAVGLRK